MILSDSQQMIRDMARKFAEEQLAPFAANWDREHKFPADAVRAMGGLGLMGITVPEQFGGAGADNLTLALALEAIAYGDAGCSCLMSGHNSVGCMPILNFGSEMQKRDILPAMAKGEQLGAFLLTEPQGGSEASRLMTKAVRDGDRYILNGTKQFITSGSTANIALVFATTDPEKGSKGITAFLVPTDTTGYQVAKIERKMGQRSSDTCQIVLEEVSISSDLRLGEEGEGYKIALSNLEGGRIGIASLCLGVAQSALDYALTYAQERQTFGKTIIGHQGVSFRLARMATELEAARQLVWHAAALKDAGEACLMEACMAKLQASEVAERVCSGAIQTLGGYGYLEDLPLERLYRDVRVTQIYEGTNDIQCIVIARELTRRD
jgi:alkylation response protein AidB-like acyl-CoA dehydrogenase